VVIIKLIKWGENLKKALVVLIVLFGVFLAIGCAGNEPAPNETGTPEQAVTEVEVVTGEEAVTPVQEVVAVTETVEETPVEAVTPAEAVTEAGNATGAANKTVVVSSSERKRAMIQQGTAANTSVEGENQGGVIKVTPGTGS
jgi:hypothetical protein